MVAAYEGKIGWEIFFWIVHLLAMTTTVSAAIVSLGSELLKKIRLRILRKRDVAIIFGLNENTLEFGSNEFYVKTEEEMRRLFPSVQEAFDNTALIAERCNLDFEFGVTKLPRFEPPGGISSREYFVKMCYKGLYEHYGSSPKEEIIKRLNYEIDTIEQMGYINYYLIQCGNNFINNI